MAKVELSKAALPDLSFSQLLLGGLGFEKFRWYRRWVGGYWFGYHPTGYIYGKRWCWYRAYEGSENWTKPHKTEHHPPLPRAKVRK